MSELTRGFIDILPDPAATTTGPKDRTRISVDASGNPQASVFGGAPAPFSGGGGGAGAFGSDVLVPLANGSGSDVTAAELITTLPTATAGAEFSDFQVKLLQGGAQVNGVSLKASNFQGRQTFTTSGATPTVTLTPRCDVLVITLGADVTSLTIAGLSVDVDYRYDLTGQLVGGNTAVTLKPNNTTNATKWHGFFTSGSTLGPLGGGAAPASDFQVIDSSDVSSLPTFFASVIGTPGVVKTIRTECFVIETNPFMEHAIGSTVATTDVTSIVLAGTIKSGSVISIQRMRPTGS